MTAYLRARGGGQCASLSIDSALQGFRSLGVPCRLFADTREIPPQPENLTVGFVGEVQRQLARLGIAAPDIDYPPELSGWLGREMEQTTLDWAEQYMYEHPVGRYFLKPVRDKQFEAAFLDAAQDLRRLQHLPGDTPVWIGPFIELGTEYRCYMYRLGAQSICIGSYRYRGHGGPVPDGAEIAAMACAYTRAPSAYALDVAVGEQGLRLVEVNDGYAVQNYGLAPADYAIWLAARWCELTGARPLHELPSTLCGSGNQEK